jgi:hypothetical protein
MNLQIFRNQILHIQGTISQGCDTVLQTGWQVYN